MHNRLNERIPYYTHYSQKMWPGEFGHKITEAYVIRISTTVTTSACDVRSNSQNVAFTYINFRVIYSNRSI